jgi:hypothetical protein
VDIKGPLINPNNILGRQTKPDSTKPYVCLSPDIPTSQLLGNLRIHAGYDAFFKESSSRTTFLNPLDYCSLSRLDIMDMRSLLKRIKVRSVSGIKIKVIAQGNNTMLRQDSELKGNRTIVTERIFDKYGLCINLRVREINLTKPSNFETIFRKTYQQVGDLWLPQKISIDIKHAGWHYDITFSKQTVNEPLNDDEFSLKVLGVKRGDRVHDLRTNTSHSINDQTLPDRDFGSHLKRNSEYSFFRYILIGVGLLLIFISVFHKYNKWKKYRLKKK